MRMLTFAVAALLALAPLTARAHGDHQHESAAPIQENPGHLAKASPGPCTPGSEQGCGCYSLGGCRLGETQVLIAGEQTILAAPSAPQRVASPASAPPAGRFFSPARPRAPPASS
jgi:hypothetical protein